MRQAIRVENLSKIYQLGEIGTGTLSYDLERWWVTKILGKEDPFLKLGQRNDRSKKGVAPFVYSLKNVSFEVPQGDAVGVVGKNGAGKSTLLKILSRVTSPTKGKISLRGRVASLLEVGTGFHPELTGRENIFLNGAIQGMRHREISRKLDAIIDFSGVELYIDTPVKRYSSGMYVRLAFAVAAYLESEILIVDEVLAVGDAEFQLKCLGKIDDISKSDGRTVLFVSHNMTAIKKLCQKSIFLNDGEIELYGDTETVVDRYLQSNTLKLRDDLTSAEVTSLTNGYFSIENIHIYDPDNMTSGVIEMGKTLVLSFNFKSYCKKPLFSVYFVNDRGVVINQFVSSDSCSIVVDKNETYQLQLTLGEISIMPGNYYLRIIVENISQIEPDCVLYCDNVIGFKVENKGFYTSRNLDNSPAVFFHRAQFTVNGKT